MRTKDLADLQQLLPLGQARQQFADRADHIRAISERLAIANTMNDQADIEEPYRMTVVRTVTILLTNAEHPFSSSANYRSILIRYQGRTWGLACLRDYPEGNNQMAATIEAALMMAQRNMKRGASL